jgi:hypothetical protein
MKLAILLLALALPCLARAQAPAPPAPISIEAAAGIDTTAPVMSTTWQSGLLTQNVTTAREKGENAAHQAQRHHQGVIALASYFPPNAQPARPEVCIGYSTHWYSGLFDVGVCTPEKAGQAEHTEAVGELYALFH